MALALGPARVRALGPEQVRAQVRVRERERGLATWASVTDRHCRILPPLSTRPGFP